MLADLGLTASTAYTLQVRARDAAGNVSGSSSSLTVSTTAGGGAGLLLDDFDGNVEFVDDDEDDA